jgi:hypothetical protein
MVLQLDVGNLPGPFVDSTSLGETTSKAFTFKLYCLFHKRMKAIAGLGAPRVRRANSLGALRHQPSVGSLPSQKQFDRSIDTYVRVVHECSIVENWNPNYFWTNRVYAVSTVTAIFSLPNNDVVPTSVVNNMYGMYGVSNLSSQLVIGISVRLCLLPAALATHARIGAANWARLAVRFPSINRFGYEYGSNELVLSTSLAVGLGKMSNRGEELFCQILPGLDDRTTSKCDVSILGLKQAWVDHEKKVVVMGSEPGADDVVTVTCVIKLPTADRLRTENPSLSGLPFLRKRFGRPWVPSSRSSGGCMAVPFWNHFRKCTNKYNGAELTHAIMSRIAVDKLDRPESKLVTRSLLHTFKHRLDPVCVLRDMFGLPSTFRHEELFDMVSVEKDGQIWYSAGLKLSGSALCQWQGILGGVHKPALLFPDPAFPLYMKYEYDNASGIFLQSTKTALFNGRRQRFFHGVGGRDAAKLYLSYYCIMTMSGRAGRNHQARVMMSIPGDAEYHSGKGNWNVLCTFYPEQDNARKIPTLAAVSVPSGGSVRGGRQYYLVNPEGIRISDVLPMRPLDFLHIHSRLVICFV